MKSKLFLLFICILLLTGCTYYSDVSSDQTKPVVEDSLNYFTTIMEWEDNDRLYYKMVYANDTKVKYLMVRGHYKYGITPLYNADGSLQIYEPEETNLNCNNCYYEFTNDTDKYCPKCGEIRL